MKKMQLLKLYDGYLQKNPKKAYISNTEFEGSIYKLVDSAYLRNNQLLKGEKLLQYLTLEQLDELDGKYNNKLKWDMLESDVTEEQLVMFEQENDLILPKQFREFALGYSFLQGRFYPECMASDFCCEGIYDKKTGDFMPFTDEEWEQDGLVGNTSVDFLGISNPNGLQHFKYWKKFGFIHIGVADNEEWLFLDCKTGEVQSWQHEEIMLQVCSKEEFKNESREGDFWFKDFDIFLRWLLGKTIYDFDKAEEEKCQLIQKRKELINEPQKNIIYL